MNKRSCPRRWWLAALLALGLGHLAQAQTVTGNCAVRFPTALPLLNGHPDQLSVPILSGGNVGGVVATNNLGATNLLLRYSAFGQNVEDLAPDAYLGQELAPPVATSGASVAWNLMTNTAYVTPSNSAFFEPSMRAMYAAVGGQVEIQWHFTDGSVVDTTYVVESAPAGRPYRVYWTDFPYNAPKVQFDGNTFVKFHYNDQITAPQYTITTNMNHVVESNIWSGLYIDSANCVNAVGSQRGMIVMQYFKTGSHSEQISTGGVIVIEVMEPDVQTLTARLGERILPQGGWADVDDLTPVVTAGTGAEQTYVYQHISSDGSVIPKMDWLFPIRRSVANPWAIEIYWKISDLMGTEWFYEVDEYAADWPACYRFVRGDAGDPGAPLFFPTNLTVALQAYQEPSSGCAKMTDPYTLNTTTNTGRCLVQLSSSDDNVWFLPIELTARDDQDFDLLPRDWMIGEELQPVATARSILFLNDHRSRALTSALNLASNFTLECWVLPGNLDARTNGFLAVFDKPGAGGSGASNEVCVSILTAASNAPGVVTASMGSGQPANPRLAMLTATNVLASRRWTHLALTKNERTLTLYLNGAPAGQTTLGTNGVRQTGATPLYLGATASSNAAPFDGAIDNVRIWSVALTADQVLLAMRGNYQGRSPASLTNQGLQAYFPINADDNLTQLHDLTGRYSGTTDYSLLPDIGAVGMRDAAAYSAWHGFIYEPYGNSYNTNFYAYPSSATADAETYIFGVNTNTDLEIWWSQAIQHPDMPSAVYIPNWVQRYRNVWPGPGESPQIVLASGMGSAQGGTYRQGYCLAVTTNGPTGRAILHPGTYFAGDFTLAAWVWVDALPPAGATSGVFAVYNTDALNQLADLVDLHIYRTNSTGGAVAWTVMNGMTASTLHAPMPTGRWVYVMATLADDQATLYLDNAVAQTSAGFAVPPDVVRTNCYVGYARDATNFCGYIDEVRIWSSVLDEHARQAAMYNVAEDLSPETLTAYLPFDPFKGHLVLDMVSGHKALLFNAVLQEPGAPALGSRRYTADEQATLYYQNDKTRPGYNPNEEHAILSAQGAYTIAYALRDDLNAAFGESAPFVLVNHLNPETGRPAMDALRVVRTDEVYTAFTMATTAGNLLNGPHPLDLLLNHWTGADFKDYGPAWQARDKSWYAVAAGLVGTTTAAVAMHNYYPQQTGFWFPGLSAALQPAVGTPIPWLPGTGTVNYAKTSYPTNGRPITVAWTVSWPGSVPTLAVGDTLIEARDGLPDIWNQLSVDVVYQQSTVESSNLNNVSVILYDPVCPRGATITNALTDYGFTVGGAAPTIYARNGFYYFYGLPPDLSGRFYYDPTRSRSNLVLVGQYVQPTTGAGYLLDNVLDTRTRLALMNLVPTNNAFYTDWANAVGKLAVDTARVAPNQPFSGLALHAPGKGAGYVALAFNNATNPALGVNSGLPITVSILRVDTNLATGQVIPLEDQYNLLSAQMSMRHSLDFAGEPGNYEFEWRWTEPTPNGATPDDPAACEVYTNGTGLNYLVLDGQSPQDLLNRFFALRYRAVSNSVAPVVGTNWSAFTGFALAEGWVQRLLNNLNPFEQRMRDLYNNAVDTQISMISQAGPPYAGDVALNPDNVNNVGLIQMYQTILNRARTVVDLAGLNDADANQQLLLAASRLNDLYMLLGNEAYADAADPTIGFGSSMALNNTAVLPVDYGAYAPAIFCFQNQVGSLLEEELALLRGRGNPGLAPGMNVAPVYNRLYWNFTKGENAGEVAYAVNYDITGHTNPVIDQGTAAARFPQGHGDAWGYYLDALGVYYSLLRHPTFDWGQPSISPMLLGDATIDVDYYDEKKFAESGAALARAGVDIVQGTYRQSYTEGAGDLFPGYQDSNTNRGWGVGQWAARAGVGALCNWMLGNSLLPAPSAWLTNAAALGMAGAGFVACPAGAFFDSDFTIEMWLKFEGGDSARDMALLDFESYNRGTRVALYLKATNRTPCLAITTGLVTGVAAAGAPLTTGVWTHVAAVLAGTQACLYVNGALALQTSGLPVPASVTLVSNTIGLARSSGSISYHGRLAEVRLWDTARGAAEIAALRDRRLTGGEAGLKSYWPLNENGGTVLPDRAYNGYSAVAKDATYWTNDMPALAANVDYDDPDILKIDRSTVPALAEIAASLNSVQRAVDNADRGLNPLGLGRATIPFDISPAALDSGTTHFEQILARAETALNNAQRVFDQVQEANRILRQQQQSAVNFQAAANDQEADYRRQLIEIYGYPYPADIGTGKTYPSGYDGPDVYHYMYVDLSALGWSGTDVEPIYACTYVFEGNRKHSTMVPYGFMTNAAPGEPERDITNTIVFTYANNGLPCKPAQWTDPRRAEGRLQMAYGAFLKQLLKYRQAVDTYENKTDYLNESFDWYVKTFAPDKLDDFRNQVGLATVKELRSTLEAVLKVKKILERCHKDSGRAKRNYAVNLVPSSQIVGTSDGGDIYFAVRAAIMAASDAQEAIGTWKELLLEMSSIAATFIVDTTEYGTTIAKLTHDYNLEADDQEAQIGELVRRQQEAVAAAQAEFQGLIQAYQAMVAVEQEGARLLATRQRTRTETANRINAMRYNDMAFRIFRDDAVSRYQSAFDLAARYTYLAAKAYDYETGLLPADTVADPGSKFLGDVVRARTIGLIANGQPQVASRYTKPGLADILAQMKANWADLDGLLGFNNPQRLRERFSLRTELYRIAPGAAGDENWRQALEECRVDNLFNLSAFTRYCLPFSAQGGLQPQEPGLVIPFSTTIDFGHNFFGRVLAGTDSAYDSSHFATKIRSVGVWFSNYNNNVISGGLSETPVVYLVPAGVDIIRSPSDLNGDTLRSWLVQDLAIPVPKSLGAAEINTADWIPMYHSLQGSLAAMRRYGSMRAYNDTGTWNSQLDYSSRLVGRSVWNTQWYLIIPAGALHGDRRLALEYFINGARGDGEGIKDIKLFFETYSYSGNYPGQ